MATRKRISGRRLIHQVGTGFVIGLIVMGFVLQFMPRLASPRPYVVTVGLGPVRSFDAVPSDMSDAWLARSFPVGPSDPFNALYRISVQAPDTDFRLLTFLDLVQSPCILDGVQAASHDVVVARDSDRTMRLQVPSAVHARELLALLIWRPSWHGSKPEERAYTDGAFFSARRVLLGPGQGRLSASVAPTTEPLTIDGFDGVIVNTTRTAPTEMPTQIIAPGGEILTLFAHIGNPWGNAVEVGLIALVDFVQVPLRAETLHQTVMIGPGRLATIPLEIRMPTTPPPHELMLMRVDGPGTDGQGYRLTDDGVTVSMRVQLVSQ